jgi:hypothetical protein
MTDFDIFWATYPRRVAKGDARKAWSQTERIRPALPELLASLFATLQPGCAKSAGPMS